jgi:hypothetical protein
MRKHLGRRAARAIPEEAMGAAAKAQEHANTIALLEAACLIVFFLAVAAEGPFHQPPKACMNQQPV